MQSLSISSFTLFPLAASVPSTAWMKFMDEVHWFARGKLQLTSHSVGNFSRWVVVLGQRKMCRRDSESREKRDCSFITSSIIIRHDVTFSHGNWVSMSTHLCWENSRRPSIFQQRQQFLQVSPIIEMILPFYHGSLKAFTSPVDGTRITRIND